MVERRIPSGRPACRSVARTRICRLRMGATAGIWLNPCTADKTVWTRSTQSWRKTRRSWSARARAANCPSWRRTCRGVLERWKARCAKTMSCAWGTRRERSWPSSPCWSAARWWGSPGRRSAWVCVTPDALSTRSRAPSRWSSRGPSPWTASLRRSARCRYTTWTRAISSAGASLPDADSSSP